MYKFRYQPAKKTRAKSETTQCLAFGKTDIRRCRLEKEPGSKTCFIHKHYYRDWFITHPPIGSISTCNERKLNEYKFQFEHGHVTITREYIEGLTSWENEYYMFLLPYTSISPSVNPSCVKLYLTTLLDPVFMQDFNDRKVRLRHQIYIALDILLQDVASCNLVFKCILGFLCRCCIHIQSLEKLGQVMEWVLETTFLEHPGWKQLMHSSELSILYRTRRENFLLVHAPNPNIKGIVEYILDPLLITTLNTLHTIHSSNSIQRINQYKEDLIAGACHPRHLERWFKAGYGFEVFDLMGWD
jgi:hypothetical protein